MNTSKKGYVKMCAYGVIPPNEVFIETHVVIEGMMFKFIVSDPNWVYEDARLVYRKDKIELSERDKYKSFKTAENLITEETVKLTPIEQEMVKDLVFENCEEEMIRIRKEQEEKMMRLFGMDEDAYDALTDKEHEYLGEPYEV